MGCRQKKIDVKIENLEVKPDKRPLQTLNLSASCSRQTEKYDGYTVNDVILK